MDRRAPGKVLGELTLGRAMSAAVTPPGPGCSMPQDVRLSADGENMGGISPDGTVMWWSGRHDGVVYAMSTVNGRVLAEIPVESGPHGLCVFLQPGRYSLGHTGNTR